MKKRFNIKDFTTEEILSVFNDYSIVNDKAYVECLVCNSSVKSKKASIRLSDNLMNCFKCRDKLFTTVISTLKDKFNNNYHKEIKINKVVQDKNKNEVTQNNKLDYYLLSDIEKKKINALLLDLFNYLDVNILHAKKFKEERKFSLFYNARSTNKLKDFISDNFNKESKNYLRHDKKTFEILNLFKIQNVNQLMYFFTDINGNFIAYQTYDIDRLTDKKRSLITNYRTQIYNVNELNNFNNSDYYFITESIEKLEVLKSLGFNGLALTGINNHSSITHILEYMKNKKFIILFDTKNKLISRELEEAIKLAKIIESRNIEVYISYINIPITQDIKEIDIDDHLSKFDKKKDKIREIKKIIKNKKSISEIQSKYIILDNKSVHSKRNIKEVENKQINTKEYVTLDKIRNELPKFIINSVKKYQDFYNNNKIQNLIIKTPAGSGKTHTLLELAKKMNNQKILYITVNKNLLRSVYDKAIKDKIKTRYIKSIIDTCNDTHTNISDKTFLDKMTKILKKRYDFQSVCESCNLKSKCKINDTVKFKTSNDTLFLSTLDKVIYDKNIINELNPDIIVFDENIINNLVSTITINLQDLENLSKYNLNNSQTKLVNFAKKFISDLREIKTVNKLLDNNVNTENISITDVKKLLNSYNDIKKFFSMINASELELNDLDIDNDSIENKNLLIDLFNAFKNENIVYSNNALTIAIKKELKLNNKSYRIFLDATVSEILVKKYFQISDNNIEIYERGLISDNLKIYQNNDLTFNQNSLLKNKNKINSIVNFIQEKSKDKNALIVSNKNLLPLLDLNQNKQNFGNLRGLNDYSNCNIAFIFNPSINYSILELKAKTLFNIENFYKEKVFKNSNVRVNGKYREIENIVYKDTILNEFLKENRESEIYQSITRINRNTDNNIKQVYLFSDIVLTDYFNDIEYFELKNKKQNKKEIDLKNEIEIIISKLGCFSLSFYKGKVNKLIKDKFDINIENKEIHNNLLDKVIKDMNLVSDIRTIKVNNDYTKIKLISYNTNYIDNFIEKIKDIDITDNKNMINNEFILSGPNNMNFYFPIQNNEFHNYFNIIDLLEREVILSQKSYFEELINDNLEENKKYQEIINTNKDFLMHQLNLLNQKNLINLDTLSKIREILKGGYCYMISSLLFFIYNELFNILIKKENKYKYPDKEIELTNEFDNIIKEFNVSKKEVKFKLENLQEYKHIKQFVENIRFTYNFYLNSLFKDNCYQFRVEKEINDIICTEEYKQYLSSYSLDIAIDYLFKKVFLYDYKNFNEFVAILEYLIFRYTSDTKTSQDGLFFCVALYNFLNTELIYSYFRNIKEFAT